MTYKPLAESDKASFSGRIHTCPLRGHSSSFQLVDEFGDGQPYAGLTYEVTDYEDVVYAGTLDATGSGKVENHYCGPVVLKLKQPYKGSNDDYNELIGRRHYPLPITELQVRAEQTRFANKTGVRTQQNPAQSQADVYYQVEVRELVEHVAHLPPMVQRHYSPNTHVFSLFRQESPLRSPKNQQNGFVDGGKNTVATPGDQGMAALGFAPTPPRIIGIALLPNKHHVLEVRPLRALRPMLSTGNEFCALNLYQLALMATLSYSDFGQTPINQPVEADSVSFPLQPSSGNWFGDALSKSEELWQVDATQAGGKAYYPLYEEVPYSKRLEVVPFDPELYPEVNDPLLGNTQENPAKLHCLDDRKQTDSTDTQAYITHHDELILIAVRGTSEVGPDALRDIDARQVPFEEGVGKVHNGFYEAAKVVYKFATDYLDKFYSGQKLVITGHSLGGAVVLILSEMLRRREGFAYDILLYTYGSPRAGDEPFVEGAKTLIHHRIVNHNDPVPSVPTTWMNTVRPSHLAISGAVTALNPLVGIGLIITGLVNFTGEPYTHHGELRHFMEVDLGRGEKSSILWKPGCNTINEHGCTRVLQEIDGLPVRGSFLRQLQDNANHKMVASYIPNSWASLRRWQASQEQHRPLVTDYELKLVDASLDNVIRQLRDFNRRLGATSGANLRKQEPVINAFNEEIEKLKMTSNRLGTLHKERVSEGQVYGLFAGQPALLEDGLPRWRAHPENCAREQLAMIPSAAENNDQAIAAITGGHTVGAPFHLDIDSMV